MNKANQWKNNPGYVPHGVKLGTRVEVEYRNDARLVCDDLDHRDLWVPEKLPSRMDIQRYRFAYSN